MKKVKGKMKPWKKEFLQKYIFVVQIRRDLIAGLEQKDFITEQEMCVCLFDTNKMKREAQVTRTSYTTTVV